MGMIMHSDPGKALKDVKNIEKALIRGMQYVGEQFVKEARNQPQPSIDWKKGEHGAKEPLYHDRTANLRSSLAYFIVKDGDVIGGNTYGTPEGIAHAKDIIAEIPGHSGIRLIGVAGMNYASAVESLGYNVITKQSYVAIENLHIQFNRIKNKVSLMTDLLNDAVVF